MFLDSNVLVSAFFSSKGAPAAIISSSLEGNLSIVVSQHVLEEVMRAMRKKSPSALVDLSFYLMASPPEVTGEPSPQELAKWQDVIDVEDAVILAAAVAARPDYLVTGDRHFFASPDIAGKSGLRIVTPAQLLEQLGDEIGPL